jgi:hypothetical protein
MLDCRQIYAAYQNMFHTPINTFSLINLLTRSAIESRVVSGAK